MYLDTLIVKDDLRHKGIGSKIWKAVLQRAGDTNVCLDSVYESLQWYKEQGFINMEAFPVTIRPAIPGDEKHLVVFTKSDGWDYSEFDFKAVKFLDPDFLIVAADHSDTPVGFGGIIDMGSSTLHLDVFIVREDLRHKGIGGRIWRDLLERAGQRIVCLDSLIGSVKWYRKQGFKYESFKLHAYCTIMTSDMNNSIQSSYNLQPVTESTWSCLLDYDKQVFLNLDREKSLRAWCRDATTVVAFSDNIVVGYGCIHNKYEGVYGLRNVFGDNETVVESILRYLTAQLQHGSEVYFTLIEGKPIPKFMGKNCRFLGTSQRMFNRSVVAVNCEKIWIHSRSKT
ncbi:uncharacterized protein LOC132723763 isoform X2 [Ruditapes philippinarum]|nr:uncharacterized protein LOC132723763 isoform X2 [Ruditapes philippinarum]